MEKREPGKPLTLFAGMETGVATPEYSTGVL